MNDGTVVIEIPGLLRKKTVKKLIFSEYGLTIEKPLSFDPIIFIPSETMFAFKYGVKGVSGYQFYIGRQYSIDIQTDEGKLFPIRLTSLYMIRRKRYTDIWRDIIQKLWEYYFVERLKYYFDLYTKKERFDLAGLEFYPFGVKLDDKGLFWNEIALSNYKSYFMVHDKENLKKRRSFNFGNDWNALLLQILLKQIVKEQDSYRSGQQ